MSISQSAGTRFLPLLSRIVLGTAFFFSGWYHCFSMGEFTPSQEEQIKSMQAGGIDSSSTQLVRWQWDGVVDAAKSQAEESKKADEDKSAAESKKADEDKSEKTSAASEDGTRAVYKIALDLHYWGIQKGTVPLAWGIAVFEVVAGALVLLGLFTRIWGLLLAVLIGGAFALTSVQQNEMFQMNPFHWRADSAMYYEMFFQAAAFVLAFGLFLVGPGILSLDCLVFGRKKDQPAAKPAASA